MEVLFRGRDFAGSFIVNYFFQQQDDCIKVALQYQRAKDGW
jgi:hypothetical protein